MPGLKEQGEGRKGGAVGRNSGLCWRIATSLWWVTQQGGGTGANTLPLSSSSSDLLSVPPLGHTHQEASDQGGSWWATVQGGENENGSGGANSNYIASTRGKILRDKEIVSTHFRTVVASGPGKEGCMKTYDYVFNNIGNILLLKLETGFTGAYFILL